MSVADLWAAKEAEAGGARSSAPRKGFRFYRPFVKAVDAFVTETRDGERIYFGIPEFDAQTRGIGRGHLCIINGYSHSGKTLLLAHILRHNRHKRIAYFTPDEPAQLVLAKLAAAQSGVPADTIEDMIASGDDRGIDILRTTALTDFPQLAVFDQPIRAEEMDAAISEAESVWGDSVELVVFDYLELLQAGDTVSAKGEFLKGLCASRNVPMIVLHQTSRSAGAEGKAQTISSGAYGGETLATFQFGVWRRKAAIAASLVEVNDRIARAANGASQAMLDQRDNLLHELERAEYTVTCAITKNKRPGRREGRNEIDFELYGDTGLLVPLADGDLPVQYREKLRQRQAQQVAEVQSDQGWSQDEFDDEEWA